MRAIRRIISLVGLTVSFVPACAMAGTFSFSDNFSPPSSDWSNSSGNWTASSGQYYAQQPNNSPEALTFLPFVFTNASDQLTVTVNNLGDGGIFFEAPSKNDYLAAVLGGYGYGNGDRGGQAGNSAYWATYACPGCAYNSVSGVFTPGNAYTLTITVVAGLFTLYNDPDGIFDGASMALTSFSDPTLTNFQVGLYDNQPDTSPPVGTGPFQKFSNFSVEGNLATPLAPAWTMMLIGLAGLGLVGCRQSRKSGLLAAA
jgi:hypothetical protein